RRPRRMTGTSPGPMLARGRWVRGQGLATAKGPRQFVRSHDVAVLFSRRSRDAYAAEATARGETYTFTDAWGRPRTWLKGEYAYLAPAAASVLLGRCNLKHDVIEEADLDEDRLGECRAVLVPNAAHLASETLERIERWLRGADRRPMVTG